MMTLMIVLVCMTCCLIAYLVGYFHGGEGYDSRMKGYTMEKHVEFLRSMERDAVRHTEGQFKMGKEIGRLEGLAQRRTS